MQDSGDETEHPDFGNSSVTYRLSGEKSSRTMAALLIGTVVVLGGAGGWYCGSQGPRDDPSVPVISAVSSQDIPDAIGTLNANAQQTAQADARECRFPMGFITAVTLGNPAGGTVIFRTSKYRSPPFHVTDKPQRI